MKREKSSKRTHRPTGHCARASAITGRRFDAAVIARRPLPRCCPLMSSIRLNSSRRVFFVHRSQRRRSVSAGRLAQSDMARFRQRELRATGLGQLGGLHQPGPGECLDRADHLFPALLLLLAGVEEVAPVQYLGDALHCGRRSPPCRCAHGDPAAIDQAQHGEQVLRRRAFHIPPESARLDRESASCPPGHGRTGVARLIRAVRPRRPASSPGAAARMRAGAPPSLPG